MSATAPNAHFPTTQWTLISRLRSKEDAVSSRALDELCAQYHYPLYCYIRRRGLDHHDAQDVLHDFLAKLIRLESFQTAEEEKAGCAVFSALRSRVFSQAGIPPRANAPMM